MPTKASQLPLTTTANTTTTSSSENSSFIYDYDYLDDLTVLVCRKDAVLSFGRVFLPIIYGLVFVLGLAGNLLLLVVLLRYAPRRRMIELYLLNLAVSNLLFVVTMPFWAISVAWQWVFGSFLCKVVSILYTINFYCGIFFITCMSLDKYLEIVHAQPLHGRQSRVRSLLLIAVVWATALAISVPEMVFVQAHQTADGVWHCYADFGGHATVWKLYLRFQQNLLGFLLPLLAMVFFYSRIGCVLVRLRPPGQGRALRMATALVAAFFLLWFPYNLTLFLHSLLDLHIFGNCQVSHYLDYALQVTESLAFFHCCFTPALYALSSRRFRRYLKASLAAVLRRHQEPDAAHARPPSYSESSGATAQEDVVSMNELGERRADDPVGKGHMGDDQA
ncbi:atypical chemokine receptor 2 [Mesocricetus auratus]|uniref:Atypical chemokine receptor 2 n=1 Tax=Mesocricetus auratus TaxID=10036 RepID=A0A1U7R773_MESAU|nr:atypical chemokine receptor 2 [Mesocricetus auratus]XP_040596066.1 atypical chemokine receptor 2 [Mesocricetus auratus]XP_040596067.1 atypical chemokine receptor 2 [Mesocricetus auratus]XP_040596068.1 atypical chemokine receptor 2 [Mesocricetus auratus]